MTERIRPEDMIARHGMDGLLRAAEEYFRSLPDHSSLLKKPFHDTFEGPYLLAKTGLLLAGLHLGQGMRVLDFGAGSCWLSRFLNELGCITVAVDPSPTALRMGEELFSRMPPLTAPLEPPRFLEFDGRRLPAADGSVDRIVSLDAFHHVPNPHEMLGEFYRVLAPGGIAGFAEVGADHSRSPQSQREMRDYQVLENDVKVEELWDTAQRAGFSRIFFKPFIHPEMSLPLADYRRLTRKRKIPAAMKQHLVEFTRDYPVFFLVKGEYRPDSRTARGLSHRISPAAAPPEVNAGVEFSLSLRVENTGAAAWLNQGPRDVGAVFAGLHLHAPDGRLLRADYRRARLGRPYAPGESGLEEIRLSLPEKGRYILAVDLVSEQVCWFETLGSTPLRLEVTVV